MCIRDSFLQMAATGGRSAVSLYRQILKQARRIDSLPQATELDRNHTFRRSQTLGDHIQAQAKERFMRPGGDTAARLHEAESELKAMRRLESNSVYRKYPLPESVVKFERPSAFRVLLKFMNLV
eukprot:TRINITY_DN3820_c0_g1_i1.p2 TRINITY_DN3820_c0_g1~~TRINITY_DN3820_c0_g1_i1.p2  ORF type:complete len:124 (+),score=27.88 TRINITY_DN3820_c0_g1_i1:166-537(+)